MLSFTKQQLENMKGQEKDAASLLDQLRVLLAFAEKHTKLVEMGECKDFLDGLDMAFIRAGVSEWEAKAMIISLLGSGMQEICRETEKRFREAVAKFGNTLSPLQSEEAGVEVGVVPATRQDEP